MQRKLLLVQLIQTGTKMIKIDTKIHIDTKMFLGVHI